MKKHYLLFSFLFITFLSFAQAPFVTTWEVFSSNQQISLLNDLPSPLAGYDYDIDFGDGTVLNNNTGVVTHSFVNPGIYTVSISGDFPRFQLSTTTSVTLKTIEQWGEIEWNSMENAFLGYQNLIVNATDTPDLSQASSLKGMFKNCNNINTSFNNWDVSNITNMEEMFAFANSYNQPLGNWNVSNVTNMKGMFQAVNGDFNQPLDTWDVSSVTNMEIMFKGLSNFNQNLDNWDVSQVTNMKNMFTSCNSFDGNISSWDVSNVINMNAMFFGASTFNQDINNWDVSNVSDMTFMFNNATNFNQPLNSWDVSNITSMSGMFGNATNFNQPLDNWNTSNLLIISNMFSQAYSFNQDLSSWTFTNNMSNYGNFINNSGLDVINYDLLLLKFYNSGISNVNLIANGLEYCNLDVKNSLANELNFSTTLDSMANNCNNIMGSVFFDQDIDGCDSNDIPVSNFIITMNGNEYDFNSFIIDGVFNIPVVGATFDVSLQNIPDYFTASPQSATVTFSTSSTEQVDFCLTANQSVNDLNITLLPISEARPGFEAEYQLVVKNIGTQTVNNVNASLTFDDTKQSFVSAMPAETSSSSNSLGFTIATLLPFQSQEIDIVMQTFTPPTVNGGDILNFTANVTPDTNDYTPNDNTYTLEQIVVNSFDPNDKRVLQGNTITTDETGEYLDYIIRFQNTGTASAINVRIEDDLHPNLDWSTLNITSASHAYSVNITNGNEVEFIFDNINLPSETQNEPESHGFIAYKIKPISTIQLGDIMSGDAGIFFDFNAPIITNSVSTEVISNLSVDEFNIDNLLSVYPNPTNGGVFIKHNDNVFLNSVKLYNVHGTELISINKGIEYLDLKNIAAGLYILSIETNKGKVNEKLVVK